MADQMMHIGELAERTGLSMRTLRHYDEIGLVRASGRTDGNFRLYTAADYDRLMLIRRMKPLGYSLEQMVGLLQLVGADRPRAVQLDEFIAEAHDRRRRLKDQLARADEFIELLTRTREAPAPTGSGG
jgi:MerR family transcriptional regulator, copper efflux regulator